MPQLMNFNWFLYSFFALLLFMVFVSIINFYVLELGHSRENKLYPEYFAILN